MQSVSKRGVLRSGDAEVTNGSHGDKKCSVLGTLPDVFVELDDLFYSRHWICLSPLISENGSGCLPRTRKGALAGDLSGGRVCRVIGRHLRMK